MKSFCLMIAIVILCSYSMAGKVFKVKLEKHYADDFKISDNDDRYSNTSHLQFYKQENTINQSI